MLNIPTSQISYYQCLHWSVELNVFSVSVVYINLITFTLQSGDELTGFFIMFGIIFVAFAQLGLLLFGSLVR